jgi:hypothetical protein
LPAVPATLPPHKKILQVPTMPPLHVKTTLRCCWLDPDGSVCVRLPAATIEKIRKHGIASLEITDLVDNPNHPISKAAPHGPLHFFQ